MVLWLQPIENHLEIVSCLSVLTAILCEKSVFFCLTNSEHFYSLSIDAFDDSMLAVDSTKDSVYQRVMFMLHGVILLIISNQHRVTHKHSRQISSNNSKKTKCFISHFVFRLLLIVHNNIHKYRIGIRHKHPFHQPNFHDTDRQEHSTLLDV